LKLISVNVGLSRQIPWKGRVIKTAIFKEPVAGPARVGKRLVEGDCQVSKKIHGGPDKAVYAYPAEHYDFWRIETPEVEIPAKAWGLFGENLTTQGVLEPEVNIGDRFRIGGCVLMVTQPRLPCVKLAARFGRPDMVKRFLHSLRTGFYLSVIEEGLIAAGDRIERIHHDPDDIRVTEAVVHYSGRAAGRPTDPEWLRRAARHPALAWDWREHFQKQLDRLVV
jgi:MOSC domain-containing protein YiiM